MQSLRKRRNGSVVACIPLHPFSFTTPRVVIVKTDACRLLE